MKQPIYKAVPMYTFNTNANNANGNEFHARPLKQWRKQLHSLQSLHSLSGTITTSIGMPMDIPGGSTVIKSMDCATCGNAALLDGKIRKDSPCTSCEPIKLNTQISDNRYTDTAAYLQSRCLTHDQRQAYNPAPFVAYFSTAGVPLEPSDSSDGAQVRETNSCYTPLSPNDLVPKINKQGITPCNTSIYKPNNSQFAQQGGVSSGSRLSRLKYNTLNNNGAVFNSATGAVGVNTGRYQIQPSPSYYTKLKPPPILYPYKTGDKLYCKNNICATA